jgi:hypothetical protein
VVTVTAGHDTRVSLAALLAIRPGAGPRLIYCTHRARRGDKRKGFTETDYARFLDAAHQQLGGPVVLVWDGLNTHTSRAMRELIAFPRRPLRRRRGARAGPILGAHGPPVSDGETCVSPERRACARLSP